MGKMVKQLRLGLVWTLSVLIGFQPAAYATGKAATIDELKSFIEASQITQKSQNFKEYLKARESVLPPHVYARLMEVASDYPDAMLPKIDVTKVKGPDGEDQLQFSATHEGKSASFAVVNGKKAFIKVNGKSISYAEMSNLDGYFTKMGLPKDMIQDYFAKRDIASNKAGILTAEQINKLSVKEKQEYFKNFRQLLESIEAVQSMQREAPVKTSGVQTLHDFFAAALIGQAAVAAPGATCIVGGNASVTAKTTRHVKKGDICKGVVVAAEAGIQCDGEACGTGVDGKVLNDIRCGDRQVRCNPAVYGTHRSICVDANQSSTALCNEKAGVKDIPDFANAEAVAQWNSLRSNATTAAASANQHCQDLGRHSKGVREDQASTCSNFQARVDTIASWDCGRSSFASQYTNLCPGGQNPGQNPGGPGTDANNPGQNPGGPNGPGQNPGNGTDQAGKPVTCDKLLISQFIESDRASEAACDSSKGTTFGTEQYCLDKGVKHKIMQCSCPAGVAITGKAKCGMVVGQTGGDGSDKSSGKKKKKKNDGPNWWLIGGLGLVGLWAFYEMGKSSANNYWKNLEPVPPAPPVPAPVMPAPRSTQ